MPEIAECDGPGNSNIMPARMAMISNDNEEFNQSDMESAILVLMCRRRPACEFTGRPRPVVLRTARRRPNSQPRRLRYDAKRRIAEQQG